jgi:hypothetical protein
VVFALVLVVAGCVHWDGHVPLVSFDTAGSGNKMLRPGARASACRTRVLGMTVGGAGGSPLESAIHALLALDPEANTLTDVRVESSGMTVGLFDRSCVTVQANVVRDIPVVKLPAPAGHHHGQH